MHRVTTRSKGYALPLDGDASLNPVASTTYFMGALASVGAGLSATERRRYIPKSGIIRSWFMHTLNTGTLGSGELSTMYLRVNNTTDYPLSAAINPNARNTTASNNALNIPVVAGDYVELKWVTPAWVTPPTALRISSTIYIE